MASYADMKCIDGIDCQSSTCRWRSDCRIISSITEKSKKGCESIQTHTHAQDWSVPFTIGAIWLKSNSTFFGLFRQFHEQPDTDEGFIAEKYSTNRIITHTYTVYSHFIKYRFPDVFIKYTEFCLFKTWIK